MDKKEKKKARKKITQERKAYKRIHENAIQSLENVGIEIEKPQAVKEIIEFLEKTSEGRIAYDGLSKRIHVEKDYVQECLKKTNREFAGDPGPNSMGIGGTPSFFYRKNDSHPLPATLVEFKNTIDAINEYPDLIKFCSMPVKIQGKGDYAGAVMLDQLACLKIINGACMTNDEVRWFSKPERKESWLDSICAIRSPLIMIPDMLKALVRSANAGNNLKLTTMPFSGIAGQTPELLITIAHLEYLCMNAIVQTIKPGTVCVYGVMPAVKKMGGNLNYSARSQNLLNAAVARLAMWILKTPSIQSGASTSEPDDNFKALIEGREGRAFFRRVGFHMVYHCFGNLENLNYLCLQKMREECAHERYDRAVEEMHKELNLDNKKENKEPIPLDFPEDPEVLETIERVQSKNYWEDGHSLKTENLFSWENWEKKAKHLFENFLF